MAPHSRLLVLVASAVVGLSSAIALAGNPSNPILFVTQVPMPEEVNSRTVSESYQSCVSPFSNHLADTAHAGRGGSLFVRFSNGQLVDLLSVADWSAIPGGKPAANTLAVRNPSVTWTADKALFSMVIGAPSGPADTTPFLWQLYELTLPTQAQLNANVKPVLTKVANQPPYNNVFPTYALGGKIVFASDRPYNGQAHLLQREEYLGLPTVSGLWSLDPSNAGSLQLLHHSPSGAFSPEIDSSGRLIFTNWDHLSRDPEAVTDSRNGNTAAPYNETFTQTFNGSGNFADESSSAAFTQVTAMAANTWDIFPEPRNFDHVTLIDVYGDTLNGLATNIFLPWMINLDGTNGELLNHVGRHEVGGFIAKNFKNDTNVVDLNPSVNPGYGGMGARPFFNNFMAAREDPLHPGTFYGSDAADLGTHGAGQIVRLNNAGTNASGAPLNPDNITVTYITPGANGASKPAFIPTVKPSINLPPTGQSPLSASNAETLYRTPVPLADGNLIASHVGNVTQTDYNSGTAAQPASFYAFRLKSLKLSGSTYVPDVTLTPGISLNTSYYVGSTLVSYNGTAWELDPVEIAPRTPPAAATSSIDPIEAGVFATAGVHLPTFQNYLRSINAALSVSRNVTKRDLHDRQQPFNLKVAWSSTQATGASGTVYNVAWIQFLQADLRRGYLLGGGTPAPGRRVVATPLHDTWTQNVQTAGAPPGALRLGDDGSFAAIVPAGKALTWHLQNNDTAKTSYVKERFWVTFQPGEIRTCANCHGINTSDQTGTVASPVGKPTNPPQALLTLLQSWKTNHPPGSLQHTASAVSVSNSADSVTLTVSRTGGNTGPVSVDYSTVDGTAQAGSDYAATSGTLSWADGDTAPKTITLQLLNNPLLGSAKTLSVPLRNPQYGSLGTVTTATITVNPLQGQLDGGSGDGGTPSDAGTESDAGAGSDAGSGTDAGVQSDAGTEPSGPESSGCACLAGSGGPSAAPEMIAMTLLVLGLAARRIRRAGEP
ncbi:MAG: Calx-beta domain-containing protein [Hyalangium sp.]|uniref:Calx-beta domain-containing protein n=1 Tax=Hyalangium sp. TaxID=2028555 RepID=UPI00389ADFCC